VLIPLVQQFLSYSGEDVNTTAFRLIAIKPLPGKMWTKLDAKVPIDWEHDEAVWVWINPNVTTFQNKRRIRMKTTIYAMAFMILLSIVSGPALAQEMIIYPAKGQKQEQMDKDKFECYNWAKKQTNFDPMEVPKATEPPPKKEAQKGGVVKGGTRGALVGVTAGAIAGDAGKGAAIGAASGALVGGMRRQDQKQQQEQAEKQWAQEQAAQYQKSRNEYNRAYGACLEGRGYTVK